MRFEFERFTKDVILRRARAEEERTGRRVTHAILTPREWYDFVDAENLQGLCFKQGDTYRIQNPAPLRVGGPKDRWPSDETDYHINVIDVVCR